MSDGGLEGALDRARAAEVAAQRRAHEAAGAEEKSRLAVAQRAERLEQAARAFVRRALDARIPDQDICVCVREERVIGGLFKKKERLVAYFEDRRGWVITTPYSHTDLSGTVYGDGLYVLRDGTLLFVADTPSQCGAYTVSGESLQSRPSRYWSDTDEQWALDLLADYLMRHGAA